MTSSSVATDPSTIDVLAAYYRYVDVPKIDDEQCRMFQDTVALVGKKWNAAILLALARGAERFSHVRAQVDGISDRLLSVRLRELSDEGLVVREVEATTPVTVRYALTRRGLELLQVLQPLLGWTGRQQNPSPLR